NVEIDPDAVPLFVIAVVELTKSLSKPEWDAFSKQGRLITIHHKYGQNYIYAYGETEHLMYRAEVIRKGDGSSLPPIDAQFDAKQKELVSGKAKPSTKAV